MSHGDLQCHGNGHRLSNVTILCDYQVCIICIYCANTLSHENNFDRCRALFVWLINNGLANKWSGRVHSLPVSCGREEKLICICASFAQECQITSADEKRNDHQSKPVFYSHISLLYIYVCEFSAVFINAIYEYLQVYNRPKPLSLPKQRSILIVPPISHYY